MTKDPRPRRKGRFAGQRFLRQCVLARRSALAAPGQPACASGCGSGCGRPWLERQRATVPFTARRGSVSADPLHDPEQGEPTWSPPAIDPAPASLTAACAPTDAGSCKARLRHADQRCGTRSTRAGLAAPPVAPRREESGRRPERLPDAPVAAAALAAPPVCLPGSGLARVMAPVVRNAGTLRDRSRQTGRPRDAPGVDLTR